MPTTLTTFNNVLLSAGPNVSPTQTIPQGATSFKLDADLTTLPTTATIAITIEFAPSATAPFMGACSGTFNGGVQIGKNGQPTTTLFSSTIPYPTPCVARVTYNPTVSFRTTGSVTLFP